MRAAAIHTGPDTYLDHVGVLAAILGIPLLLTEPETYESAKKFYPQADASLCDLADLSIPFLAANFDAIFESGHLWAAEMLPLFELLCGKKMRMVYVPHGNSDKGHSLQAVPKDVSLVYGRHMLDLLEKTGGLSSYTTTGNYRSWFYRQHKPFYDALLQERIRGRLRGKKILLYAPTWADGENPTSFFSSCEKLIAEASPHFDLIVKLHPFLEERSPAQTWKIVLRCQDTPGAVILDNFPAIYPILDLCDGYVGDFSSIGYDFLRFRKPMFFLEENDGALKGCGQLVPKNRDIGRFILDNWSKHEDRFLEEQKRVYAYAFGEEVGSLELKKKIESALSVDRARWN